MRDYTICASPITGRRVYLRAVQWLKRLGYDANNVNMKDLVKYIIEGSPELYREHNEVELYRTFGEAVRFDTTYLTGIAWVLHEIVEVSEIKKKYGSVIRNDETYAFAHPIAEEWELKYLKENSKKEK